MFPKIYRLAATTDFNRVYKSGYKSKGEYGMLIGLSSKKDLSENDFQVIPQIGIVTSKKIGKANVRNKTRRRVGTYLYNYFKQNPVISKTVYKYQLVYVAYQYVEEYKLLKNDLDNSLNILLKKTL